MTGSPPGRRAKERRASRRWPAVVLALLVGIALGWALRGGLPGQQPSPDSGAEIRNLLATGGAQAGIDQWSEALDLFRRAAAVPPGDPVAEYDIAVALYRLGETEDAAEAAAAMGDDLPGSLRARIAFLAGRIAFEDGDLAAEAEAYRRAMALDPSEAAYPYALAQVLGRRGDTELDRRGELLSLAFDLWPANWRLRLEYARWLLETGEAEAQEQGLDLLMPAVTALDDPQISALLVSARDDLTSARSGVSSADKGPRLPVSVRRMLNLLRPAKPYQVSSGRLEDRLQASPILEPITPSLRRRRAMTAPTIVLDGPEELLSEEGQETLASWTDLVSVRDLPAADGESSTNGWAALAGDGLYLRAGGDDAWRRLSDVVTGGARLLAGELNGDTRIDLIVVSAESAGVWLRGGDRLANLPQSPAAVMPWGAALLVDFEHDGDLDLLLTDAEGALYLAIHRGEAGMGQIDPAPLDAGDVAVRFLLSSDLDGDADQDLVLGGDDALVVLRNWRQGDFEVEQTIPLPAVATSLVGLDYDLDGHFDVVGLVGGGLVFWRGDGDGRLRDDAVAAGAAAELAELLTATHQAVSDLDLDGDQDLVVAGRAVSGAPRVVGLENRGRGHLVLEPDLLSAQPGPVVGLLTTDADGDGADDLLVWNQAGALEGFRSRGAEEQDRLALELIGLAGKVPLDGRGVRVHVAAGDLTIVRELSQPALTLGLGQHTAAVVRITWPNGISEYLYDPPPWSVQRVEQLLRIEGSCPFLYAFDGREMRFVTDILGLAPVGMLSAPGEFVVPDPEEYLRLPDWVRAQDGSLDLVVSEELREVAYFDQFELVAVAAPNDVEVYNGEQWVEPPVDGLALRLLSSLRVPLSVLNDAGEEVLSVVASEDHDYLTNHRGHRVYQGAVEPHRLTVELPADLAAAESPVLVLTGWLHWANTSVNIARSQDPKGRPIFPYLEVEENDGSWRRIPGTVGLPAGKTKPVVIRLAGVVDAAHRRIRLTTDFEVYWDRLAVGRELAPEAADHRLERLAPATADLRQGGFSRWFRPAANGPYLFDYSDRRPVPWRDDSQGRDLTLGWQEHEGYYTSFGPTEALLARLDGDLAVIGSGDEIRLRFDLSALRQLPEDWRWTYFLHTEGWEKDGDPNVANSQTVGPLPSRASGEAGSGTDAEDLTSRTPGRQRWVSRHRLEQRAAASGG